MVANPTEILNQSRELIIKAVALLNPVCPIVNPRRAHSSKISFPYSPMSNA